MIEMIGNCKFCGQGEMVEIPDDTPESMRLEEACHQASLQCSCKEGSDWRATMWVMDKCSENIEVMFREKYPEIADILQEAKDMIYVGTIKRITCVTPESGVAVMYKRGGSIMVKFTQKKETEMSAEW